MANFIPVPGGTECVSKSQTDWEGEMTVRSFKSNLMSTAMASAFVGVGVLIGGVAAPVQPGLAAGGAAGASGLLPMAKPKPRLLHRAACNPCKPCAAKACNPRNPCAAKKACNPRGAAAAEAPELSIAESGAL